MSTRIGFPIVDGAWRVRETDKNYVDVRRMGFGNLRIILQPKDDLPFPGRSWCYKASFAAVVAHAHSFDPDAGESPIGWIKETKTGRRACAWLYRSRLKAHHDFDPTCPDCGRLDLE